MTHVVVDGTVAGACTSTSTRVSTRLHDVERMDYATLQDAWRRLYRVAPPRRVSRDLLILGVAWKIQEQAHGGLTAATRRRLNELAQSLERDGDIARDRVTRLKPGARIIREWGGASHTVIVGDDGFTWNGRPWRSLSAIAREITGAKWSGPRFFGLKVAATKTPAVGPEPIDA